MIEELKRHNAIVRERIMKSFGYADTEDFIQKGEDEVELIQKGEIDYDWELEKAVYADTPQNRRLNRVGQEYHRSRKKKNMDDGNDGGSGKLSSQASKTDTSTLKKVANSDKAPQAMKDAAKKALQNRGESGDDGRNKAHEQEKRDRIKGIRYNGAGVDTDIFIDNNKTDYYKSIMKKYGVSDVGELADKLGEEDGGYDKYDKIYTKMLRQIPASAFHKEYGD